MPSYQLKNGTATYVLDTGQALPTGWTEFDHEPTLAEMQTLGYVRLVPRDLGAIITDLTNLTATQKTNVWTDITSGTPPKWQVGNSDPIVWSVAALAYTAALDVRSKIIAVAAYVRNVNPAYLVTPAFDTSINISGTVAG